ncbi:ABC transporter ATP-binding protein [Rhizobium sp. S95]|uniref:ABC transporter ATP-binding protein n=1 Tax=Ciceribacter sichuanensis TaxID=2949647 RepID=A0AAJ1F9I4_9HYPH|nr:MULTISPECIES: ABC transporter ATP-binding protein [unclassified Ciceribacter]MCM2398053.1 ABC transporter ATP-binding protein [Ciceribacter sp. S95]MCO5959404.1 ABC transporter ATP-binding protein [Ciceribacter sp. S101]
MTAGNDNIPERGLSTSAITLAYRDRPIIRDLDIAIAEGSFSVIVGANGSGKSTLLKALARLLKPETGSVLLDGQAITTLPSVEIARRIGLLPQTAEAPEGITVADLVARGRYPHQTFFRQWSRQDETVVAAAMQAAGIAELADRAVDTLSGGQCQRAWIAMVLAQETPILLLDEPTTFLDMAHQADLLDLLQHLNTDMGRTVIAVLHDLNQAFRYATHIIAMREGTVVAEGRPADVVTEEMLEKVFDLPCMIIADPVTGTPHVIPRSRRRPMNGTDAA